MKYSFAQQLGLVQAGVVIGMDSKSDPLLYRHATTYCVVKKLLEAGVPLGNDTICQWLDNNSSNFHSDWLSSILKDFPCMTFDMAVAVQCANKCFASELEEIISRGGIRIDGVLIKAMISSARPLGCFKVLADRVDLSKEIDGFAKGKCRETYKAFVTRYNIPKQKAIDTLVKFGKYEWVKDYV